MRLKADNLRPVAPMKYADATAEEDLRVDEARVAKVRLWARAASVSNGTRLGGARVACRGRTSWIVAQDRLTRRSIDR